MKRFWVFLALSVSVNCLAQNNEEFRATWIVDSQWISPGTSENDSKAFIRQVLDNHVTANMTSVIWQIRRYGSVYYYSVIEPWGERVGFSDPGFDPLEYAIEEAHARGLEFHAWFNSFESRNRYPGSPAQLHPDWICRDQDGIPMPDNLAWLSPGLAPVREHLVNVAMEIVNNYDIDGLHLDFVRWSEHTNSGTSIRLAKQNIEQNLPDGYISEAQMQELVNNFAGRYLYDVEHPYDAGVPAGFNSWEEWWRWSVTEFVSTLHDSIQAVKPWVRLSPAALGRYNWGGWQGYDIVYQDAGLWLNERYIDQLVGMHYHWDQASEIYGVLTGGCPDCWSQYIQPAIQDGQLYTVGLYSDSFFENGIFGRHNSIIERVRDDVDWVDGFQFFSYGSWRDLNYWEDASRLFFSHKAKIRGTGLIDDTSPNAPALDLTKLDSLRYSLTITPPTAGESSFWYAIYRSEDDILNKDEDQIIDIHFGENAFSFTDSATGYQDFNGTYTYFSTAFDRFWNESTFSNIEESDSIPSFAPAIVSTFPAEGDSIPVNSEVVIDFSKTIDTGSGTNAISLSPETAIDQLQWSDDQKSLTIRFAGNLAYSTSYSLTLTPQLVDVNGRQLDGNNDGVEGDPFVRQFTTFQQDLLGPQVVSSFPGQEELLLDGIVAFVFDEIIDVNSLSAANISFVQQGNDVPFGFQVATVNDQSVLSIQATALLDPDQEYTVTLSPEIADTSGNQSGVEVVRAFRTSTEHYSEVVYIDQFLSVSNWFQPNGSGSTSGIVVANTSFSMSTEAYLPNVIPRQRISPALTYEWDQSAGPLIRLYLSEGPPRSVQFDNSYILQCFVFGDGSNNKFRFALDDKLPEELAENHEVSNWVTVDWVGWRIVEWDLSDPGSVGSWIGDGSLDGQMRFDSFQLTHESGNAVEGRIFFDNLRLVKKSNMPVDVASDHESVPAEFRLNQNYPNPFNPSTVISFDIARTAPVSLKVYDVLGREVRVILEKRMPAGRYKFNFDAGGLASGVYIYRLSVDGKVFTRRMLYIK